MGQPDSPGLTWTATAPKTDKNSQLVVALGSEGISCGVEAPTASYQGYEKRDGNVIIKVEPASSGRPVTHGAIIPRPQAGGKLLVEAVGKLPYGKSADGKSSCDVPY